MGIINEFQGAEFEALSAPAVTSFLRRHALERPAHTALVDGATAESVTYAEPVDAAVALRIGVVEAVSDDDDLTEGAAAFFDKRDPVYPD